MPSLRSAVGFLETPAPWERLQLNHQRPPLPWLPSPWIAAVASSLKKGRHKYIRTVYRDRGTVRMNQKPMNQKPWNEHGEHLLNYEFGSQWSTVIFEYCTSRTNLFNKTSQNHPETNYTVRNWSSHFEMKINGSQVHTKTTRSSLFY